MLKIRIIFAAIAAGFVAGCDAGSAPDEAAAATPEIQAESPQPFWAEASPISDKPHPSEMAIHCIRVAVVPGSDEQADACRKLGLWGVVTKEKNRTVSDRCLFNRLIFEAYHVAKESGLVPERSPHMLNWEAMDACNKSGQGFRIGPFPSSGDIVTHEDQMKFIRFALAVIGEDEKWSELPALHQRDLDLLCEVFEVATDEQVRAVANKSLKCYLW